MSDLDIKQVYDAKPTTTIPDDALLYLGLSPYGLTDDSAIKAQDVFPANGAVTDGAVTLFNGTSGKKLKTIGAMTAGQVVGGVTAASAQPYTLTAGTNMTSIVPDAKAQTITFNAATQSSTVSFQNNYFIADNGSDSTGDGTLSAPFFTANHTLSVIRALTPSATNRFYIYDERTTDIVEDFQLVPFVTLMGNGTATLHGDVSLHSSFGSITSDTSATFGGYKEWLAGSTLTLDFSSFGLTHQIIINLINVPKAPINYPIIGNDGANFNMLNFGVNEINFNTAGRDTLDNSYWQANCSISSGVRRKIRYCNGWQLSSITKSLGSIPCVSELDVAFCGIAIFDPITHTLKIISSGGANNQPMINVSVLSCITDNSNLFLDITNDGQSFATFTTDITTGYLINSFNSLTNFTFQNNSFVDYQNSTYFPTNYTRSSYDDGGFIVTTDLLGSQLNGIDIAIQQVPALQGNNISNLNNGIGYGAFAADLTGANNSWCGMWCFKNATDLQLSAALGFNAGSAYTGSEHQNICIAAQGVVGDFQTTRIGYTNSSGTTSTQLKCFIDGIYQATSSLGRPVVVDSTGQLYQVTNPLTVTQGTSIVTGVTLNSRTGVITTVSTTLAALTATSFVLTNSQIASTSGINAFLMGYSGTLITAGVPYIFASAPGSGSCTINIVNLNALAALNGTITIGFEIV